MKKVLLSVLAVLGVVMALAGCSGKDVPSFQTLEDNRATARANAEFNAQVYRAQNPRMADLQIVGHGDTTQTAQCPQGDGWASISLMGQVESERDEKGNKKMEKYKVKCSTVSSNLGCYIEADFKARPQLSSQENNCDANLPFPLPKIAK